MQNLWESSFVLKYSKFILDFKNEAKNWKRVFCFWGNWIWTGIVKLFVLRTGYFLSAVNVLTSSTKILHVNKRDFFQLNWLGSHQRIWWKCRDKDFNSAFARLPCCLSKGRLKQDFLDIYLTTFSESVNSEIQNLWGSSFVSKYWKFNLDFKNEDKNLKEVFCFWGNCIWTGIVKSFLLRTGYFSSADNVLTSSTKDLHVNKRDFFQLNWLDKDQWIWSRWFDADFNNAWARLPCCLLKGLLKLDLLVIYQTTVSESVTSEIQKRSRSSSFQNVSSLI